LARWFLDEVGDKEVGDKEQAPYTTLNNSGSCTNLRPQVLTTALEQSPTRPESSMLNMVWAFRPAYPTTKHTVISDVTLEPRHSQLDLPTL
jgi:hypothetical protein